MYLFDVGALRQVYTPVGIHFCLGVGVGWRTVYGRSGGGTVGAGTLNGGLIKSKVLRVGCENNQSRIGMMYEIHEILAKSILPMYNVQIA